MPDLLNRALEASGERTKKAAVTRALEEFIARREHRKILDLFGTLEWDDSYDYKADRPRTGCHHGCPSGVGCRRSAQRADPR